MLNAIILAAAVAGQPAPATGVPQAIALDSFLAIAQQVVSVRKLAKGGIVRAMLKSRASEVLPGLCVSRFIDIGPRLVVGPPDRAPAEPLIDIRTHNAFRVGADDLDMMVYAEAQEEGRIAALQRRCEADIDQAGYFTAPREFDAFMAARVLALVASKEGLAPSVEVMCNGTDRCTTDDRGVAASFRAAELVSVSTDDDCKDRPLDARVMCMTLSGRKAGAGQARGWSLMVRLVSTGTEGEITFSSFRITSVVIARNLADPDDIAFDPDQGN